MSERLAGKVAVITGAGQGIGRAAALAFATAGSTVWAVDRNAATLDTLQAEQPLIKTKVLDVTDAPGIARFAEEAGTIDVLFNCAGYVHAGSILDSTESDWDDAMNVRWTIRKKGSPILFLAGQSFQVTVQDDLTDLTEMFWMLQCDIFDDGIFNDA